MVELDEHTGSSYEGQFSSHTQRASNASNALQTAKYSHVTLMHGSRSLDSIKYSNIVSFFSIFKASVKRSIFKTRKDWVFWYVFYLCQPFKTLINHEFLNIPCYLYQWVKRFRNFSLMLTSNDSVVDSYWIVIPTYSLAVLDTNLKRWFADLLRNNDKKKKG